MWGQALELRDYARMDAWVVPTEPVVNTLTEEDKNGVLDLELADHLVAWDFMAPEDPPLKQSDYADLSPEEMCR